METKICIKCNQEKPLTGFRKRGFQSNKQRYRGECKDCSINYDCNNRKYNHRFKKYYTRNRDKIYTNELLRYAVKQGLIVKPGICEVCQKELPKRMISGHHRNYNEPFKIIWVCHKCHKKFHG